MYLFLVFGRPWSKAFECFFLDSKNLRNCLCQRRSTLLLQTVTRTPFAPQGTVIAAVYSTRTWSGTWKTLCLRSALSVSHPIPAYPSHNTPGLPCCIGWKEETGSLHVTQPTALPPIFRVSSIPLKLYIIQYIVNRIVLIILTWVSLMKCSGNCSSPETHQPGFVTILPYVLPTSTVRGGK